MESLIKWITESMSLLRFISIFMLCGMFYAFLPDGLNDLFLRKNPEFAPNGTLKAVLLFCSSFMIIWFTRPLENLVVANFRKRKHQKLKAEYRSMFNRLSDDEKNILFEIMYEGGSSYLPTYHACVISLSQKGFITIISAGVISAHKGHASYRLSPLCSEIIDEQIVADYQRIKRS